MPNIHSTISFGLVNIPVLCNLVVRNNDVSFNQLHKKCGNRITYQKYCPHCHVILKENEIIKGYEYEKGEYLEFNKKELNDLKPENEEVMEIISFINLKEIEPSYFEKNYYLSTEKKSKAYNLFVSALEKSKLVALCKTVLHNKFYYGVIRYYENALILTTLYFDEEINLKESTEPKKVDTKELELALKLIGSMKGHFEPQKYKDEYQNQIKKAIDAKLGGKKIKTKKKSNKKQVTDLMKALEKSLKK